MEINAPILQLISSVFLIGSKLLIFFIKTNFSLDLENVKRIIWQNRKVIKKLVK